MTELDSRDVQVMRLLDCAHVLSGGTPSKDVPEFWGGSIPWVSAKDMKIFRLHDAQDHLTPFGAESGTRVAPAGSTLVLVRGMTLHDHVPICWLVRDMAFNQDVKAVVPKGRVHPEYLAYWLAASGARLHGLVDAAGHGTGRIGGPSLQALPVRVPPLDVQCSIAGVLGAVDRKIELCGDMNRTIESTARAIFESWFIHFDPVRKKVEGADVGLHADLAALFPNSFEPSSHGAIPSGWRMSRIGVVAKELEAGSRPSGGVGGIIVGIPSIGAESITGIGEFNFAKTKRVSRGFWAGMRRGHVKNRDILVYKDGGRPGMFEPHVTLVGDGFPFKECCINEHVYRLQVRRELSQVFAFFWLTSDYALSEMRERGTGVAIPSLNSTAFRDVPILVPDDAVVQGFTRLVEPLLAAMLQNANEARALETTRAALLPRLLSGELETALIQGVAL